MKKLKILVTGGPVHAYLDSVKMITNRFKGGRMAQLAGQLADQGVHVTYIMAKDSVVPWCSSKAKVDVVYHNGFDDYKDKVLELAPKMDSVVLGAAVCNLIPMTPFEGKFPSHNYKVGDRIPIDFTIAPRVIDMVRKVAPKTKLFGFKLLQGVKHKELIEAAYDIVLESGAVAVFANDANDLDIKYAVTKEKGIIEFKFPQSENTFVNFIIEATKDKYYSTEIEWYDDIDLYDYHTAKLRLVHFLKKYNKKFTKTYGKEKYKFGTVAVRIGETNAFVTTARGKKEMEEAVVVHKVDHRGRKVYTVNQKATLNAPLLHKLLKNDKSLSAIVHYHEQSQDKIATCQYSPPGTVRDANIADTLHPSHKIFQVEGHGIYKLLTEEDL